MELHELVSGLGKLADDYAVPAPPWISEGEAPTKTAVVQTAHIMATQQWDYVHKKLFVGPHATVALGLSYYDLPYLVTVAIHQKTRSELDEFTAVVSLYASVDEHGKTAHDFPGESQEELGKRKFETKVWNHFQYHVRPEQVDWASMVNLAREQLRDLFRMTRVQPEGTGPVRASELTPPEERSVKPEIVNAAEDPE